MNNQMKQFSLRLDQLLGIHSGQINTVVTSSQDESALQIANLLKGMDFGSELAPRIGIHSRWVSQTALPLPDAKSHFPLWTKRNSFMQILRARPGLLIVLVLLALGLLTGVAYAIGRSLGYIPGVGLVELGKPILTLAEPVTVRQNGLSFTVKQVVADSSRTFVAYQVDGISPVKSGFPLCTEPPVLQLQDGTRLDFLSGGGGAMESQNGESMSFRTNYTFPSLPAAARSVIILSPCQMPAIELVLVPGPADFITPAVEIGATYAASAPTLVSKPSLPAPGQTETVSPEPRPSSFPDTPVTVPKGSGLHLDKVFELENSYLLIGNFANAGSLPGALALSSPAMDEYNFDKQITDSHGETIDFKARVDIRPATELADVWYWVYEIPKPVNAPLTLILNSAPIHQEDRLEFSVDVGQNPQAGQKWPINRAVKLGGYDMVIDDITAREKGYSIHFHSAGLMPESVSFDFGLPADVVVTGGTGEVFNRPRNVVYGETRTFDGALPAGNLIFSLMSHVIVQFSGPWTLTWSPPAGK
ncbi:MAG: hypothetical protein NTW32_12460 [Chloroflexi bacterium]|nr:hypothetical protein [Chloroflexota bacterium]